MPKLETLRLKLQNFENGNVFHSNSTKPWHAIKWDTTFKGPIFTRLKHMALNFGPSDGSKRPSIPIWFFDRFFRETKFLEEIVVVCDDVKAVQIWEVSPMAGELKSGRVWCGGGGSTLHVCCAQSLLSYFGTNV